MKQRASVPCAYKREICSAVVVSLTGLLFLAFSPLDRTMDYLFAARHSFANTAVMPNQNVTVVFIEDSDKNHTNIIKLLDELAEQGAKAAVLDIVLISERWEHPEVVSEFTRAVSNATQRADMKLVFATEGQKGKRAGEKTELGPSEEIQKLVEVEWLTNRTKIGVSNLQQLSGVIRRHSSDAGYPHAPLVVAIAQLLKESYRYSHWINYYGPPGTLAKLEARSILAGTNDLRAALKGKVVFIGQGPVTTDRQDAPDRHETPFTCFGPATSSGIEIHATAYSNLVNRDWIKELAVSQEYLIVAVVGVSCGFCFTRWPPRTAFVNAVSFALAAGFLSFLLFTYAKFLPLWLIVAVPQMLAGFAISFIPVNDVFISFRGADGKDVATIIADGLKRMGIEAFIDLQENVPGKAEEVLIREVRKRHNLVLVVTPEVITSWGPDDFIGKEIDAARAVVPVYLEGVGDFIQKHKAAGHPLPESLSKALENTRKIFHVDQKEASVLGIANMLRSGIRRNPGPRRFRLLWRQLCTHFKMNGGGTA
ncbi:MAG: CHASE2 domain-containing protein [Verrucomicrobia bacterium]|nr:CHASE2 domain-containing protein [Verrucomicrobiota bacterium]